MASPSRHESTANRLSAPSPARQSSIRIRRLSASSPPPAGQIPSDVDDAGTSELRRPYTTPEHPSPEVTRQTTAASAMPAVAEEVADGTTRPLHPAVSEQPQIAPANISRLPDPIRTRSRVERAARSAFARPRSSMPPGAFSTGREYGTNAIDLLDVVDPEVSTLSTLTNVQNSLFVPNLGRMINRRPEYELTPLRSEESETSSVTENLPSISTAPTTSAQPSVPDSSEAELSSTEPSHQRRFSVTSQLDDSHYAVLPHLFSVEEWNEEDVKLLNDHVRHQLHSRRARFKRSMRGFKKYLSKPLGFFVTLYAVLITLFGLVWILFIIGWLSAGERTPYIENIVDNVLVALFAIIGDGLAPFRIVDTYHMCFIAHYHHLTWRLRREKALPPLQNQNDLPSTLASDAATQKEKGSSISPDDHPPVPNNNNDDTDLEDASIFSLTERPELSMLKPAQQRRLEHHQAKFAASHSFYKPHETSTHHAFPLRMLVAAVVLLDCHSIFQIMLGAFTWGWTYHTRPPWITAVILSLSITVNITAGIVISIGDKMTRKKDVIEKMFRQALTEEGIRKLSKKKRKRAARERRDRVGGVKFSHEHHAANRRSTDRPRFSLDAVRHIRT